MWSVFFLYIMIVIWLCILLLFVFVVFFFKQKTAYEMRISDWSSDVCSSDLAFGAAIFYGYEASYQEYQKISENFITGGGRLGAFVGQPNWNAAVIAMALPFAFYLRARGQLSLISVYVTGAVLALGLVLSASFTGFVSALIVLFLFLIVGGTRQTLKAGLVLAVAGAVLLASGFELPGVFQGRVGEALGTGDLSQARPLPGRGGTSSETGE